MPSAVRLPSLHLPDCPSPRRWGPALALALAAAAGAATAATEPPTSTDAPPVARPPVPPSPTAELVLPPETLAAREWSYVFGLSLNEVPTYSGSGSRELRIRPLWALQYGKFRLSTSGARAVMGFGGEAAATGSGASLQMVDTGEWKLGASLRLDGGRSASDDPSLAGLPEIRRTLRARLNLERRLGEHWSLGASLSQDLLGRAGGATASAGLGYGLRLGPATVGSLGLGLSWGDATYLRTHYGVPDSAAAASGYRPFSPGAGLIDTSFSGSVTTALTPRWIAFAGAGVGRLVGDAADSPLTRQAGSWRVSVGLAYRCCKP